MRPTSKRSTTWGGRMSIVTQLGGGDLSFFILCFPYAKRKPLIAFSIGMSSFPE